MENAENITSREQPQTDTEVTRETGPAQQEYLVPEEAVERFLPGKARAELVPLVRFLKCASFREKLIAVALEILCSGDIEITIARDHGLYHGQIGTDLLADWTKEVFGAISTEGTATPEERVLAAYVAGLSVAG
jgi:hypothetical protein